MVIAGIGLSWVLGPLVLVIVPQGKSTNNGREN